MTAGFQSMDPIDPPPIRRRAELPAMLLVLTVAGSCLIPPVAGETPGQGSGPPGQDGRGPGVGAAQQGARPGSGSLDLGPGSQERRRGDRPRSGAGEGTGGLAPFPGRFHAAAAPEVAAGTPGPTLTGIAPDSFSAGRSLTFSPRGRILAALDSRGMLWLWATQHGRPLGWFEMPPVEDGRHDLVRFGPDGGQIAYVTSRAVHVHRVPDGSEVAVVRVAQPWVEALRFDPSGRRLAVLSSDGGATTVRVHALPGGRAVITEVGLARSDDPYPRNDLAFSPDGSLLAFGDAQGRGHLLELATGRLRPLSSAEQQRWFQVPTLRGAAPDSLPEGLDHILRSRTFSTSPDGRWTALCYCGCGLSSLTLWDPVRRRMQAVGDFSGCCGDSFSPDSRFLVAGEKLFELSHPERPSLLTAEEEPYAALANAFDPARPHDLATAYQDGVIRIRDASTRAIRWELVGRRDGAWQARRGDGRVFSAGFPPPQPPPPVTPDQKIP